MISCKAFYDTLIENGVDFFAGVPDSLLKNFCAYITDNTSSDRHFITANEGNAIGLAVGYHLGTNKIPMVYFQNSGLGNAVNPLLSIADELVYSIPMILLIGWRGEPGIKDEPQHIKQGAINEDLLNVMGIPYEIIDNTSDINRVISSVISGARNESKPYALLVREGSFAKYSLINEIVTDFPLNREEAIKIILDSLNSEDIIVSTTGKASREVYEYREANNQAHDRDFLTVGAMGHTSSIAVGVAISQPNKSVYCLDGDGSVLMHMGALCINANIEGLCNFKHIVINNGAHDSVGGQPTVGFEVSLAEIAKASGYLYSETCETAEALKIKLAEIKEFKGAGFLEIRVNKGARENLGRPATSPIQNKLAFQSFIN